MILDTLITFQDYVEWGTDCKPIDPSDKRELLKCLQLKIVRNVGQALIEALVLISSCIDFLENQTKISQVNYYRIIINSSLIVDQLASLHDKKQIANFEGLLGNLPLVYPKVTPEKVMSGPFLIDGKYFRLSGQNSRTKLLLNATLKTNIDIDTPTLGCPAHRLVHERKRLNTIFWLLLVNLFDSSGRFGEVSPNKREDSWHSLSNMNTSNARPILAS